MKHSVPQVPQLAENNANGMIGLGQKIGRHIGGCLSKDPFG